MEVWAVVSCVASVVQLIDVSARCVSKSVQYQRSSNGILEPDAAIEDPTVHLSGLKDEVDEAAIAVSDPALHSLCTSLTSSATDLLAVLNKLKVEGPKTKWKTIRKAIRSVWSKEQVHDLEQRLAGFREVLNLHILVRLRQQLDGMTSEIQGHIQSSDAAAQRILKAVLAQQDIFAALLHDHESHNTQLQEDTRKVVRSVGADMQAGISRFEANADLRNQEEHGQTRQLVQLEIQQLEQTSQTLQVETSVEIQSSERVIVSSINMGNRANQADHDQTRRQIAELKMSVNILAEQIEARDLELRELLVAFNVTRNAGRRKKIGEKSNAVTAALLALRTMYNSLLSVLATLESSANDLLNHARTVEIWKITEYARKLLLSKRTSAETQNHAKAGEESPSDPRVLADGLQFLATSQFNHKNYFSSYYSSVNVSAHTVNSSTMEQRWKFEIDLLRTEDLSTGYEGVYVDSGSCDSQSLWLMASITVVLHEHVAQEEEAFMLLARTLDSYHGDGTSIKNIYSRGHFSGRLRADMKYWNSFARSRGLNRETATAKFAMDQMSGYDRDELGTLMRWFVTFQWHFARRRGNTQIHAMTIRRGGPAWLIAKALADKGLQLKIESPDVFEAAVNDVPTLEIGYVNNTWSLAAGNEKLTLFCPKCWTEVVEKYCVHPSGRAPHERGYLLADE